MVIETTPQAQPATTAPEFGTPSSPEALIALNTFVVEHAGKLYGPNADPATLTQYRELSSKTYDAPESNTAPVKVVAPANSGTPADAVNAAETYKRENAAALFSRNPDRAKVAELARLNAIAYPDVPDTPGAEADTGMVDSVTQAALAAASDVPDSPEKYRFDDLRPAGMQIDKALDSEVRNLFHEMGLSQSAARTLVLEWEKASEVARIAGRPLTETEITNRRDVVAQELRQLWGSDAGRKADLALSVIAALPADKRDRVAELLVASGLNNSKAVIVHLAGLAEARAVKSKR